MNSIDKFTQKFHKFEENLIPLDNWEIWDGIRYYIYFRLLNFAIYKQQNVQKDHIPLLKKIKLIFEGMGIFKEFFKSKKLLIVSASRFKNSEGKWYDPNITDIWDLYPHDAVILDNWIHISNYAYKAYKNSIMLLYKKFYKKSNSYSSFVKELCDNISSNFGIKIEESYIRECIASYKAEYIFYKHLLKILHPKLIFVIQSGPQQALFKVAKELSIPTAELQHGNVYFSHISYSYPKNIKKQMFSIPDYYFAYSGFWKSKIEPYYPVKKYLISGNSAASEIYVGIKLYDITFVSNSKYTQKFIELIKALKDIGFEGRICLKLHPQQIEELDEIKDKLNKSKLNDVDLIFVEKNIKEIIGMSRSMVMVHSTTIYEALDAGVSVFLYKEGLHAGLDDIKDHPLIDEFETTDELRKLVQESKSPIKKNNDIPKDRFFEPFRKDLVKEFIHQFL